MGNKIREFIGNNSLSFEPGSRNSTMVTLMGYAQHLGLSKKDLEEELSNEIDNDDVIQDEIDERWGYAEKNNYAKFWKTENAHSQYIF